MLLFVPIVAVLSFALFLSVKLGAHIENCVLATLSAIVIVLFVASLYDLLAAATYALASQVGRFCPMSWCHSGAMRD